MVDPSLLVAVTGFVSFVEGEPKYLTVADMERAAGISRKVRRAVRAYVAGDEWPALALEKVSYDWRKLSKAVKAFDVEDVTAFSKMIGGLPASPELSGGYTGAMLRVINYVTDQMPHNAAVQMTGVNQRDPSSSDIYRWGRCVTIAEEPLYALEWMHEGRLTSLAVDCITACYPPIFEMLTAEIVEALAVQTAKGGWRLPRDKEAQLSKILGSFAAPGLQEAIQGVLDQQAGQAKSNPSSSATASRLAKSYHSTSGEES